VQQDPATDTSLEKVLAATAVVYGGTILNPLTEVFASYKAYEVMARHGSEIMWGGIITAVGVTQLMAVSKNGPVARKIASLLAGIMWTALAGLYFQGRLDSGLITALTSPGVIVFLLWGYYLCRRGFELKW
jgi:hypothetical protein